MNAARPGWLRRHRLVARLLGALLAVVAVLGGAVGWVQLSQRGRITDLAQAKPAPVALVLGAGLRADGTPSTYLARRLDAGRQLYQTGTVSSILITGNGTDPAHDEIAAMRGWLEDHGVPVEAIVADPYGIDTHDSCVRAHDLFGIDQAIVVTQSYHLPRALFLCEHAGIESQGVGVSDQSRRLAYFLVREAGASVKAAVEVLLGTSAQYGLALP